MELSSVFCSLLNSFWKTDSREMAGVSGKEGHHQADVSAVPREALRYRHHRNAMANARRISELGNDAASEKYLGN